MLLRFHANLFVRPAHASVGNEIELRGCRLPTIRAPAWAEFFPATFEQTMAALTNLSRIDAEPDGFFVISGDDQGGRWQVDGHLFDFDNRLHRMELHGACPAESLDGILRCVGWPATAVAFELVMEGVALDEAAFRRWAGACS